MSTQMQTRVKVSLPPSFIPIQASLRQRKCACGQHTGAGGECEECRQKREGMLQRAAVSASPVIGRGVPPIVHEVLSSPGKALDTGTRAFMEPRFGHDFSKVRIHNHTPLMTKSDLTISRPGDQGEQEADRMTGLPMQAPGQRSGYDFSQVRMHTDAQAAESARAINALAYTVGQHLVFGTGQYAPQTNIGKRLLAHELTHVVQQTEQHNVQIQRKDAGVAVQEKKTPYERPDPNRVNLCFIMGTKGVYKIADWFAQAYYSGTHKIIKAASLCGILEEIQSAFTLADKPGNKIGLVIIISHADKEGRFYFPINENDKNKYVTLDEVAKILSPDWLENIGINCRFAARDVARASDAQTHVIVKGCNIGQNKAAIDTLRQLFGGQATATAPKKKVEMRGLSFGPREAGRKTPAEVISWMVKNGYLPPEAEGWPEDKKKDFVLSLFPPNAKAAGISGIPADFLIIEGKEVPPSDPRYRENLGESKP